MTDGKREFTLRSGLLRVRFHWHEDRFAHALERNDGGKWRGMLHSVEGTPEERWPPSPAWQEIDAPSTSPEAGLLWLVGCSGKTHWSASVTAHPQRHAVTFDVAARVREVPPRLGQAYRSTGSDAGQNPNGAPVNSQWEGLTLRGSTDAGDSLKFVSESPSLWRMSIPKLDGAVPRTVRWTYEIVAAHDLVNQEG